MGHFERKNLSIETRMLADAGRGNILEVAFSGVHDHHWPYGEAINGFIRMEVQASRPAAILFDFSGYHYEWGNEIGGPIMTALLVDDPPGSLPLAIVANGITFVRLKSLFQDGMLDQVLRVGFFESSDKGLDFLWKVLGAA
jgi:hypothetical protein